MVVQIWTLVFFLWGVRLSFAICDGIFSYKPCCRGERWDTKTGQCLRCPLNHYGENCTFTCSVPFDGYRCVTGRCTCNKLACNVEVTSPKCVTASPESFSVSNTLETTVDSQDVYVTLPKNDTRGDRTEPTPIAKNDSWGLTSLIFIGLGACGVLLFCFIVMECVSFINMRGLPKRFNKVV